MSVWCFLSLGIDTRAVVLNEVGCFTEPSIVLYRKHAHTSAPIICYEYKFARIVNCEVTRTCSDRGLSIQKRQCAACLVNGKRTYAPARFTSKLANFVDSVKISLLRMDSQERRIFPCFRGTSKFQSASDWVHAIDVNAFTLACGIGADVKVSCLPAFRMVTPRTKWQILSLSKC